MHQAQDAIGRVVVAVRSQRAASERLAIEIADGADGVQADTPPEPFSRLAD
jgi:hypothetical protein